MRIGIDMMGGDYAPVSTIRGALLAREALPGDVEIILIGDRAVLDRYCYQESLDVSSLSIEHTPEWIGMEDHPLIAFRKKSGASIFLGVRMLKEGILDGFCSAGNSGALLVGVTQILSPLPGIIRPAIAAPIPVLSGDPSILLDVGLNPDARPDVLYQYGVIGTIYSKLVHRIPEPDVALLNIGLEEDKGNMATRNAYQLMKDSSDYHFVGNIEANELFVSSRAQVIVTDGFVGNMLLKEAEAFYSLVRAKEVCNGYFEMFNFENYGGTPVLGINAPILIGHGISTENAIKNMLIHTYEVVDSGLVNGLKEELNK